MEIIKKVKDNGVDMVWVAVDATNAVLIPYSSDAKALDDAKAKYDSDKVKKNRLAVVQDEIKRIKNKYNKVKPWEM